MPNPFSTGLTTAINKIGSTYSKGAYALRRDSTLRNSALGGAITGALYGAFSPNDSMLGTAAIGAAAAPLLAKNALRGLRGSGAGKAMVAGGATGGLMGGVTGYQDSGKGFWNTTGGMLGSIGAGVQSGILLGAGGRFAYGKASKGLAAQNVWRGIKK